MKIKRNGLLLTVTAILITLSTTVMAADEGTNKAGGIIQLVVLYGVIIGAFYFFLIRPQKKKQKKEAELRESIVLGDEVTSIGGVVGRIVNIKDDELTIETSVDKTLIQYKKWAVRDIKKQ